jgi:hypothetical protein
MLDAPPKYLTWPVLPVAIISEMGSLLHTLVRDDIALDCPLTLTYHSCQLVGKVLLMVLLACARVKSAHL